MAIESNRQQQLALEALNRVQDELRWRAFMLALSGQCEELEEVLKDIDTSKAPNGGWAKRVRGIAAHESGDNVAAVTLLKEAIALGDRTVAAFGPMVAAHWALNDNPGARPYGSVLNELIESTDERSLEDEFFLASMTCWDEPQRAYEIANRVFAKYPSPAVLRVRSYICRSFGNHTGDVKWFEQAIADGHAQWRAAGKDGAPEFPMWCHASAIDIAKANGDQKTVDYHTLVGKRLASQLKERDDYGAAYTAAASAVFYEAIGDLASAEEAHRVGAMSSDNGKRKYAAFLVTHCEDERALRVIDQMDEPYSYNTADICRVAVLAESPDTRPQVRGLILERLQKSDEIQWVGFLHQFGFPNDAKREASRIIDKLRAKDEQVPPAYEFFAGKLNEEQLEATAGNERLLLADAHFRIIQRHLGDGNRETAKECLEKWPPILWERAHDDLLLTRMANQWERDPNWPHWISAEVTKQN